MSRKHTVSYAQILENQPFISITFSYGGQRRQVLSITENIEQMGFKRDTLLAPDAHWDDFLHPEDRPITLRLGHTYIAQKLTTFRLDYRLVNPAGEVFWIKEYSHITRDAGDNIEKISGILLRLTDGDIEKAYSRAHVEHSIATNEMLLALQNVPMEESCDVILKCVGKFAKLGRTILYEHSEENSDNVVMREWFGQNPQNVTDGTTQSGAAKAALAELDQSLRNYGLLIMNAGEESGDLSNFADVHGLTALVAMPVYSQGKQSGGIIFCCSEARKRWDGPTLDFLKNASRLLSTVLGRLKNQEQILRTKRSCEAILNNIDAYIYAVDPKNNAITFANHAFRSVFGMDCIGKNADEFILLNEKNQVKPEIAVDPECSNDLWAETLFYEVYLEKQNQWLSISKEPSPWVDGRMVHLIHCYDSTAHKHYEDGIKKQAYTDYLTGLPNRHQCDETLSRLVNERRGVNSPFYLFFIDLDDFKIVNDSFGHDYGDGVLKSFAKYLTETYTGKNQVFRLGGDEFVIVVDSSNGMQVPEYLDGMLERAKSPWKALDKEFHCSLSIGVVEFIARHEDAKSLLKKADIAMYQAKKSGKNNYAYYTEGLDGDAVSRSAMESMLRKAISNDFAGIEILYQPYYSLQSGAMLGAEALLRIRDDSGKLVPASEFITLAEYLGLIVPIGDHVLRKAAGLCKRINESGRPDFNISINFSAVRFKDKNVVQHINSLLASTGVKYENVFIGINEGLAMEQRKIMLAHCQELRNMGIRVIMDDFGSGNASFINMRNLPVDKIKLSPIYLYAHEDEFTAHFMEMVVHLCRLSGKALCVSGVETETQLKFCRKLKVDTVQGFLLHTPAEAETLLGILDAGLDKIQTGLQPRPSGEQVPVVLQMRQA